jgi:hypothetical protein
MEKSSNEDGRELATRLLTSQLGAAWAVFLFVLLIFLFRPVQTFLLVCWAHGSDAYFRRGIRLMHMKPARFSDGSLVPVYMDLVTGFATFFGVVLSLTFLLILAIRVYEKRWIK